MCTLVVLRRPAAHWPLVLAANRDEMLDRPWRPPGRHWPGRPHVVAGLDELAGGAWLGVNDDGLAAGVLNRHDSLGPQPDMRSRGELVLEALDHAEAGAAARVLADLDPAAYRTFNLVVADARAAYWVRHADETGRQPPEVRALPAGLSMLTAHDLDDPRSPRIARYLPRFRAAPAPDPERGDWAAWQALLAERAYDPEAGPTGAMTVVTESGFGTSSASLIALPAPPARPGAPARKPVWLFAAGPPDEAPFRPVEL